jgi:predicted acylesterase/phospholipase RssA
MTIKHLVLPGGGAAAIRLLGALQKLHDNDIWNVKDIESIHAVSAGTIIGVLLSLKFDMQTIVDYIIQRPWGDVFKVGLTNIFDVFLKKGFFNTEMFVTFVKPFFDTRDISLDITMKEFYELTKVKLYFYTVELNKFELVQVSHETFPELQVIKAVHMSAAYPVMLSPVIINDKCYVDGGVICNYPINYCIDMGNDISEILGVGSEAKKNDRRVTSESTIFEYLMELIYKMVMNIFDRVRDLETRQHITNYVSIHIPSITIGDIQDTFNDIEIRKNLLREGASSAQEFLQNTLHVESMEKSEDIYDVEEEEEDTIEQLDDTSREDSQKDESRDSSVIIDNMLPIY